MTVPYFYRNDNSRFLSVEGKDSSDFLQNLITNDINKCTKENIIYSCLLTPQGKFIADFFIFKKDDNYIIETHSLFYETLLKKLKLYKLRSKILINEITNLCSYSVFSELNNYMNFIIFCADPRSNKIGNKLICKSEDSEILKNVKEIDEKKYHEILIRNTVPLSHFDLKENKSLLLENNFENLNAISWDKGCYVGQELTARMKYRALLKKRIYSLAVKDGTPQIEQAIKDDENDYGKIINVENSSILAMLNIELAESKINEHQKIKTNDGLVLEFIV
ncbi:MAG: YgfZ/GcvT domain-containing protein [Alphaproteobacteria bacterium]